MKRRAKKEQESYLVKMTNDYRRGDNDRSSRNMKQWRFMVVDYYNNWWSTNDKGERNAAINY